MWEQLKNALTGTQEALWIEIRKRPIDLTTVGEAATSTAQAATESTVGVVEGLTAAADRAAGDLTGVTKTPTADTAASK
jgi:hypothetical protein